MIYKCKKCNFITDNKSIKVCPKCGNKIILQTETSTNGICDVYGIQIDLTKELNEVLKQYEENDIYFDIDNIIKKKIKKSCPATSKKDRWCIKQYCKKYKKIPSTIPIEFYIKYEKKNKKEQKINQRIAERKLSIPHCPNCNSTNIQKISMTSRAISGLTFGILSSSIGKTFKCKNCGYKW